MTCHDARERFSAWVDAALSVDERAAVQGHVAACADCRHELARFEGTLALVRSLEPARAPVGFVDRVLRAARPAPWYGRLFARLFVPLPVKLPIHAAAMALLAVTAVYLYERTPELQQATRAAAPAPPPAEAPPTAAPAPAPIPGPGPARGLTRDKDRSEDAPEAGRAGAKEQDAPKQAAPPSSPPRAKAEAPRPTPSPQVAPSPEAPPAAALGSGPARERRADALEEKTAKRAAAEGFATRAIVPPDVGGRLAVPDREAGRRALAELLGRVGGAELSRRQESGDRAADVVEIVVPGAGYGAFVEGLARIGRWQPDREPAELPARVRVDLRITE